MKPKMNILVSGAGGVIGSSLVPFLTTGGHRVIKLVRRQPVSDNEIFWDPFSQKIDLKKAGKIDAVIHLAGENIGNSRWTAKKKKRIIDSRVKGTGLIAKTISRLEKKPDVFICASAIGYYGDRGEAILTENDKPGDDFLSTVCAKWENEAENAIDGQIRTSFMRIGVVLTPEGGALNRLLLPFKLGGGGRIGSGRQYMSWICIDDVIGSIHHILMNDDIYGPVNLSSPNPATNKDFTKILGKILGRPTFLCLPGAVIDTVFGEMGREILLSSTKVTPKKLLETGYEFRYPDLEKALNHLLGKK